MRKFLQVLYVFFSALLVSLAIPNELFLLGSPYIALIALAPFYVAVARSRSYREAALLGALHTASVHLMSSFWLAFFKDFAAFTLGASAAGTAVIGVILGRMLYLPYARRNAVNELRERSGNAAWNISFRIFWFAGVYTLYEWLKASGLGFLAYPWGVLSSAAFRWRLLMQIADLTGAYGVSFLFALCSAVCAEGVLLAAQISRSAKPRALLFSFKCAANTFAILIAAAFVYGAFQYAAPRVPVKKLNAVLVQQNSNPWEEVTDADSILLSEKLSAEKMREFSARGEKTHLVVWSEGVLRFAFPNAEAYYATHPAESPLREFIAETQTPFLIGGSYLADIERRQFNNAALLFDKDGNFRGHYGKIHLVPFAEVLPGAEYDAVLRFMERVVGISAGWLAGDRYVLFEVPAKFSDAANSSADAPNQVQHDANVEMPNQVRHDENVEIISLVESENEILPFRYAQGQNDESGESENDATVLVSAPICFGDAFPSDVCRPLFLRGSEVFINLTDDSWSHTNSAEYQHFVVASYRAIEFRTTLVRSTNAGYSVVLDAAGRVLADMPLFAEDALAVSIPVYKRTMTVYALLGNWLPALLAVLTFAYCVREAARFLTITKR